MTDLIVFILRPALLECLTKEGREGYGMENLYTKAPTIIQFGCGQAYMGSQH